MKITQDSSSVSFVITRRDIILIFTLIVTIATLLAYVLVNPDEPLNPAGASMNDQSVERQLADHINDDFPIDLNWAVCPGATNKVAMTKAWNRYVCRDICARTAGCDVWQWCVEGLGLCSYWDDNGRTMLKTEPGYRCYLSTYKNIKEPCVPDFADQWIGGTNNLMRVPFVRKEPVTLKRGMLGFTMVTDWNGNQIRSCEESSAMKLDNSWYATWQWQTSSGDYCRNSKKIWGAGYIGKNFQDKEHQLGNEFVPQIQGVGMVDEILANIDTIKPEWERANVNYLMGYNEPDPKDNHPNSVDAYDAAFDWVKVQQLANMFDPPLILIAPAPARATYSTTPGVHRWMEYFMRNCSTVVTGCDVTSIKYMALHDYTGDINMFQKTIDGLYSRWGRPVWVTEYAIGNYAKSPQRPQQDAYLKATIPMLESHPAVHRYVWHYVREPPSRWSGFRDLIVWNQTVPQITSTGLIYRDAAKTRLYD